MIVLLVPMLCVDVFAENKTVSDFTGLKDAIAQAENGDTITVNRDIAMTETLVINGKDITITGSSKISADSQVSVTDPAANPNVKNTLFAIKDSNVTFEGLTLSGSDKNRVIYSEGSEITLTDAKVINGCPGNNSNINPGGGIFLRGGSLTATNTDFIGNTPGTNLDKTLPEGDRDKNGGAIYVGSEDTDITINGGSFVGNKVEAYGHGAAIYQNAGELTIDRTSFSDNSGHYASDNAGTQGACIHTRDGVTADISKVDVKVARNFNTGGFLRSYGSTVTVSDSTFTIDSLGDNFGISGGVFCFQGGTSSVKDSTFECKGNSKVSYAGGFIDIVGGGTHVIEGNKMTGRGKWNGTEIASFGGAISIEQGSNATVTIQKNTITNSSASNNGGAIAIGTHKGVSTPATVTMSENKISNGGTLVWGGQVGGGVFIAPNATVTMTSDEIDSVRSGFGGGIYNEGKLTLTGTKDNPTKITNNQGYSLGGGVVNDGYLKVDFAKFNGNFKGDGSVGDAHIYNKNEMAGENIYARKDVIITPNAEFDGKDVRIIEKNSDDETSKIILTGPLTKQINVSISETKKPTDTAREEDAAKETDKRTLNPRLFENQHRRVGYLVAVGDGTYTPTAEDAQKIHYVSKDTDPAQPRADFADHTSPGKWDYVLNPENNTIVLGQRVKLVYHGNTGKIGTEVKKEKTVDAYKAGNFWEKQLDKYKVADPEKAKNEFMGWYFWEFGEDAGETNNDSTIQALKKPEEVKANLFDFSKFDFSNKNETETTNIITPNVINTYAGWSENIDLKVEKQWKKADGKEDLDDNDKVEVKINLKGGEEDKTLTLNSANEFKGKFENLPVFTKSYDPAEKEINMNLKFTPKVYKVEEDKLEGFATSYKPETITANSDAEKKFTITNKKEEPKNYKVNYEFISRTPNKALPTTGTIVELLPKDDTNHATGEIITAGALAANEKYDSAKKTVDVEDGTWTFKGWVKEKNSTVDPVESLEQTITDQNLNFVGVWTFEAKTGNVYVKYIAEDGTVLEAESAVKINAAVGEAYTTEQKAFDGYEFSTMGAGSAAASGKVIAGDLHVIYVYKKIKPTPEPKSDFTITKSVDKQTYEKAGDVLTYTIVVTNTGEKDLTKLKLTDQLVNVKDEEFNLAKGKSETFTYTYTITEDDVKATSVTNVASVTHDDTTKEATATSILKEKEKRGDVYVRYETEDGKILDEFAVLIDAPVGTYYYTEEKAFPRYRFVGLAPYSDPAEGYVVEDTQYVVYLYRRDRGGRTPDRRDRYEREEKEVEEPIVEAKRKPELNKKDHKQYMYGYPDWTFVPAANITRGEAAAMFARLFKEYPGLDYNYKKYYTDVDESYWGFKEVAYLSEFGILSGYSDGTFRPNNKITRAEFVKIAESFEALTWGLSPYNDVDGGHWAFRYIVSSAAKGWISGYPDGSFRPNSFISRAEAVTIVNRLLERRPDKDYIDTHKPELKPFTDLKPSYWAYYEIYEAVDGHDYNRSFTDIDEHWYRLNNERFVFSQPRYYR